MNERRDFYVYIWFRPWDGSPCNVGKGRGKRYREWWRPSNPRLVAIIRKAGGSLPSVIIRDGLTEAEAFETERALIAAIGRKENGGPLANLTDGGEGVSGHLHSEETKKASGETSRLMWADPEMRQQIIAAQAAGKATPEFHEIRSAASRLMWSSPDRCAALSRTKSEQYANPSLGLREKVSRATREAMARPEVKAKVSAAQKARFARKVGIDGKP